MPRSVHGAWHTGDTKCWLNTWTECLGLMPSEVFAYSDVHSKRLFSKRDLGAIFGFADVLLNQLAPHVLWKCSGYMRRLDLLSPWSRAWSVPGLDSLVCRINWSGPLSGFISTGLLQHGRVRWLTCCLWLPLCLAELSSSNRDHVKCTAVFVPKNPATPCVATPTPYFSSSGLVFILFYFA